MFHGLEALRGRRPSAGSTWPALALAWVMHHPRVTAPIVGPRRPEQLEPARAALELTLTPDEHAAIGALFPLGTAV